MHSGELCYCCSEPTMNLCSHLRKYQAKIAQNLNAVLLQLAFLFLGKCRILDVSTDIVCSSTQEGAFRLSNGTAYQKRLLFGPNK